MKKFLKVIIAFVIIAVIAVGAYFIFRPKSNNFVVYNKVYDLNYSIQSKNVNVVEKVDRVIEDMLTIIREKPLNIVEAGNSLTNFVRLRGLYSTLKDEILGYGSFCGANSKANKYVSASVKSYNNVKNIYLKAYDYLKETYFKILETNYTNATMETYIVNFDILFKDVFEEYNNFYYNSCMAYSKSLDNMMVRNSAYKLKVEYATTLINLYFEDTKANNSEDTSTDNPEDTNANNPRDVNSNVDYYAQAAAQVKKIADYDANLDLDNKTNEDSEDTNVDSKNRTTVYFKNKAIYDDLINKTELLDLNNIAKNAVLNQIEAYVAELPTEEDKALVNSYVEWVINKDLVVEE